MAERRRSSFSGVWITALLAVMLLPAFLSAGPIVKKSKGDAGESIQERSADAALHRRLIRNRRNISWYKQHSDFWSWYKFFTDNGNQEAVQEMDRIYLAYLQNKNRAEGRRSYKAYLRHLGEIYKSCADSDDPNCVASHTTRPKPEPPKPAPVKTCDPTKDTYCLYIALVQGKSPYLPLVLPAATPAPAPAKVPAPLYVRSAAPAKEPQSGYMYFAPSAVSFLSKEQKAELLRICSADDVECLQYHLRAAHGYAPSAGPLPSYAHLGCDPKKDPTCKPKLVQKAPSGLYLQYPNCDPRDPFCAYAASLVAPRAPNPPAPAGPGSCNPLFEEGCNPLTATRFATPPEAYKTEEKEEAAALRVAPPAAEQNSDPYSMFRDAYTNANRVNDHYAVYRQASAPASPPASDPFAMLRRYMAQAQASDPYAPRMEAAPDSNPNDPFSAIREAAAAMHRRGPPTPRQQFPFSNPSFEEPPQEERHPLGPPGKTKEGYDCFIGYDRECFPVKPTEPRSGVHRRIPYPAEAYEPHLNADGTRNGVLEPSNPHCDPEYDRDCRLRRFEPEQTHADTQPEHHGEEHSQGAADSEQQEQEQYDTEPYQSGQEEPHMSYQPLPQGMPSLQDILRRYGDQFSEQDDHRAYADDYRKK
ncbi:actinodin1 isoform X1 [Amphiprion ocellaris]|uniref:Actinodin1 n=1 Tax=Amphiprion ocellaris TaxID=80972 RepID=A0A3Q1CY85_AMPOC|nr:actinodin1 isoform X1 [Amphiprion ocellaris]XP_023132213.2 actinodin1 isoform X1 [Amphiprion ocellaris]